MLLSGLIRKNYAGYMVITTMKLQVNWEGYSGRNVGETTNEVFFSFIIEEKFDSLVHRAWEYGKNCRVERGLWQRNETYHRR